MSVMTALADEWLESEIPCLVQSAPLYANRPSMGDLALPTRS